MKKAPASLRVQRGCQPIAILIGFAQIAAKLIDADSWMTAIDA
jgi:hypothetical protein